MTGIGARQIGMAAMRLGCGPPDDHRHHRSRRRCHPVGEGRQRGVSRGDVLATLRFNDRRNVDDAAAMVAAAFKLADRPPPERPLVLDEVR